MKKILIKNSKWPALRKEKGKDTTSRLENTILGRYTKTVEKRSDETVKITEEILNYNLTEVEWTFSTILDENDADTYLEAYNKEAPPLNECEFFENWL